VVREPLILWLIPKKEVERIARVAFDIAMKRDRRGKSNAHGVELKGQKWFWTG